MISCPLQVRLISISPVTAAEKQDERGWHWKGYQAILLLDEGWTPSEAPTALSCSVSSVYKAKGTWLLRIL